MKNPIAVSSWSLHHLLGITHRNGPGASAPHIAHETFGPAKISLEQLPKELVARGYARVELCQFHFASQEPDYLKRIGDAFKANGVVIQTLLIDDGDITNPETRVRDMEWIESWIEVAALLGAEHARVIAGKSQPSDEALQLSVEGLKVLSLIGQKLGFGLSPRIGLISYQILRMCIMCLIMWEKALAFWLIPAIGGGQQNMLTCNRSLPGLNFAMPRQVLLPRVKLMVLIFPHVCVRLGALIIKGR